MYQNSHEDKSLCQREYKNEEQIQLCIRNSFTWCFRGKAMSLLFRHISACPLSLNGFFLSPQPSLTRKEWKEANDMREMWTQFKRMWRKPLLTGRKTLAWLQEKKYLCMNKVPLQRQDGNRDCRFSVVINSNHQQFCSKSKQITHNVLFEAKRVTLKCLLLVSLLKTEIQFGRKKKS